MSILWVILLSLGAAPAPTLRTPEAGDATLDSCNGEGCVELIGGLEQGRVTLKGRGALPQTACLPKELQARLQPAPGRSLVYRALALPNGTFALFLKDQNSVVFVNPQRGMAVESLPDALDCSSAAISPGDGRLFLVCQQGVLSRGSDPVSWQPSAPCPPKDE